MRKFLYYIFFYLFSLNNCYSGDLTLNDTYKVLDSTKQKSSDDPLKLLFEEGIKAYEKHNYNNAISIWKKVLKVNEKKKNIELGYKTKVNIGAAYNAIGYHKTASQYFISVNSAQKKNKNDMYWVNNINIGVCYMSLEQYELAKQYFESTKEITPYISFVKKLNLAKWYGLNNDKPKFFAFQKEVSSQIKNYPMFESIWEEVQLEFLILWKEKVKLKNLLQELKPKYKANNLFLKLKTNQGLLLLDDMPLEDISGILKYENEVNSSNDLFLKNLYFKYLKEFYYKQNNIDLYRKFDNFWEDSNEKFVKEKNLVYLEDFKAAERLEELQGKFSQEQLKNQLIQNQLSKSNLMFRFSIIVIVMGLGIIFLLIRNYKKNKKILLLNAVQSQNEILKKEFEKIELSENLKETSDELNTSIINIKKVALLKKQLENIADEKDPNYNEKETLKKLKLCLNSFFDNYRELTQIMQKKLNVDKIINHVNINFPEITEKEKRVIEYITLHFTTKEIALLMDKSEKSIEYYRSQIRKKMNLGSNSSLEEFLNSFF